MLARTSGILMGEANPLPELLDQLRATFSVESVALDVEPRRRLGDRCERGPDPPTEPFEGERWDLVDDGTTVLVLRGTRFRATTSESFGRSCRTSRSPWSRAGSRRRRPWRPTSPRPTSSAPRSSKR